MQPLPPSVGSKLGDGWSRWALVADRAWLRPDDPLLKQLLLVFDGFITTLPASGFQRSLESSPELAVPLQERGLLVNVTPEEWLDPEVASVVGELLWLSHHPETGDISSDAAGLIWETGRFDPDIARLLYALGRTTSMADIGYLAGGAPDGLHKMSSFAATEVGMLVSRVLDPTSVFPMLDDSLKVRSTLEQITAQVASTDMRICGPDLELVPLDEVLDFRTEARPARLTYLSEIQVFSHDLLGLEGLSRDRAIGEREEILSARARDMERNARRAFGTRVLSATLGASAAVWPAFQGDPVTAGIGFSAAIAAWRASATTPPESFILRARAQFDT